MDLFVIAIALYLLGTLTMLWPKSLELKAHYTGMILAAAASGIVAWASAWYLAGMSAPADLFKDSSLMLYEAFGRYSLEADGWSAVFLLITGLSGCAVSIYGIGYGKGYLGKRIRLLTGLWNLFILSMVLVLMAGDALTFIFAWEVMAIVSFLLVNHESEKKKVVDASYQYMVMTHIGTAAILISFYIIGSNAVSFAFDDLEQVQLEGYMKHLAFAFAFIGFGLKSGLMPLHVWLPNAHPAAPSHVSALMSGVMLKVAVYGFGRFILQFIGYDVFAYGLIVMAVGLISAFLGVLYASMEKDMKRILAYSSVENMGIIFTAFGCGMILQAMERDYMSIIAFTSVIFLCLSHSLMKCLLFMSAGAVLHATGTKNIEKLGGLAKKMPWTAFFTLIGCMSLASLPLTSGFVGEWMTLQSVMTMAWQGVVPEMRILAIFAFILLGFTGALALGCFVRMYGVAFLGRRRSTAVLKAHEMPISMRIGMGIQAILIVLVGIVPGAVVERMQYVLTNHKAIPIAFEHGIVWNGGGSFVYMSPIAIAVLALVLIVVLGIPLMGKNVFVYKDVTWNCGTVPTRRQQYTATGFTKPLRRAFDWILKPRRERVFLQKDHDYFGRKVQYNLMIPDRFSDKLYHPLEHIMVKTSEFMRVIQQGSVRLYIAYTMIAMVVVLIWGVM